MRRAAALWCSICLAAACSSTDVVNYGPPGGLTGKKLPMPSTGVGSGSGGAASGSGAGSSGGAKMDAGSNDAGSIGCTVSWATQIFPNMTAGGRWKCSDATSCHGGLQAPKMTADATATYKALSTYTMQFAPQKLPYILPGSTDPAKSGIVCNLSGGTCGTQMPLAGVVAGTSSLTSQEIATLNTWVACGAPDN